MIKAWTYISLVLFAIVLRAQSDTYPIEDVTLRVDTMAYSYSENTMQVGGEQHILFGYRRQNEVMEVELKVDPVADFSKIRLLSSADFGLLDSLRFFDSSTARFKVVFKNLNQANFLRFIFEVQYQDSTQLVSIPMQAYTNTYVAFYPSNEEVYIGEEKVFELTTNNIGNIEVDERWTSGLPIDYRVKKEGRNLKLFILPNQLGNHRITVPINLRRPVYRGGKLQYQLEPIEAEFSVREGRLVYLQLDQQEVTLPENRKEAFDVQIQNHRFLRLNKTYRIEDQENPGGALVAELFTKTRLNNDRILSTMRVYALHRKTEGYLFIKDGDEAMFVTNADITPQTKIQKVFIQRNGNDWKEGNQVYPGETIYLRLEGLGLHKGSFTFQGVENLQLDSLVKNESIQEFKLTIPEDVSTKYLDIYNENQPTGTRLLVREYQRPRDFDFINLELSGQQYNVGKVDKPIFFGENLSDLVLNFDRSLIDNQQLHGKQYLTIDVKVSNKQGSLIEIYKFEDIVVCPDMSSPRSTYYGDKSCSGEGINLNNFLNKKTYDLEEWSRIDIEISHDKEKYGGEGDKKRIQIYLQRDYNFDIDVSFPAGLLILKGGEGDFSNFGGPSFAMIAQFSFYQPGKIAKYRPYKLGVGFIAIDAFNFSNSDIGDIGLVVIGSLYPTSSDRKLTFPLFAGFGYLLKEQAPFFLVGPGIRVRL